MAARAKKTGAAKIRSAAFRRIRADHQSELAEDYVELIADLIATEREILDLLGELEAEFGGKA